MRMQIAAVLYPIFESMLFGVGAVATALLAESGRAEFASVVHCALAALILAIPLAWEAAPLLLSDAERRRMDDE
jgi:drug/metabolite transporter (DMT)-like permease